jgi:hypothetical protein
MSEEIKLLNITNSGTTSYHLKLHQSVQQALVECQISCLPKAGTTDLPRNLFFGLVIKRVDFELWDSKWWKPSLVQKPGPWIRIPLRVRMFSVCACVCVFLCLCAGRGLVTSWSPVRGVLPSVPDQETEENQPSAPKAGASSQVWEQRGRKSDEKKWSINLYLTQTVFKYYVSGHYPSSYVIYNETPSCF